MKVATGEYLNIYSEMGHYDDTDLVDDALDIFIIFSECYSGSLDFTAAEEKARNALETWKKTHYVRKQKNNPNAMRFITEKVKKVLEEEFEEEACLIIVREIH